MNYIELINNFWKKDIEYNFSDKEIALYFYLLSVSNSINWKNPFGLSNSMTIAKFGWGKKSFDTAKNNLQKADLISFKAGDGRGNVYQYEIKDTEKVYQKNTLLDTLSTFNENMSEKGTQKTPLSGNLSDTLLDTLSEQKGETSINININKTKEIETEKKAELNYPFSSDLFFEKWNLLASSPKWKVKATPSLQIALDGLKKFDEAFVIEMIDQAIVGDWSVFKGVELSDQYTKWKNQKEKPPKTTKESKARFRPPTLEEVKAYCLERKNKVDPEKFIDFYTARGWKYNNTKISDWEACVRTWEKNNFDNGKSIIGDNPKLSEAYKAYQEQNKKKVVESHSKNDALKVTPKEYKQMKDNGIEIKKDITPEELEEIRKRLKEL